MGECIEWKVANLMKKKIKEGIAFIVSFILISLFLYFKPNYFHDLVYTRVVGITFGFLGFMGLSVELNKISLKVNKWEGIGDIATGSFLIIIFIVLQKYSLSDITKIFLLFIPILSIYGIILGFIKIFNSVIDNISNFRNSIKNIFLIVVQLFSFVLTILQLLKIFKFIN